MLKTLDISAIPATKENIAKLLDELNNDLTQDEIDELTYDKRREEAEQADRSYNDDYEKKIKIQSGGL